MLSKTPIGKRSEDDKANYWTIVIDSQNFAGPVLYMSAWFWDSRINWNPKSAFAFLNSGNGKFSSAKTIYVPKSRTAYAVGASNILGDIRPEIVIASTARKKGNRTEISIYNGSKLVQKYLPKNNSTWTVPDIQFADVNSDGSVNVVDIVVVVNLLLGLP